MVGRWDKFWEEAQHGKGYKKRFAMGEYVISDASDGWWISKEGKYLRKLDTILDCKKLINDNERNLNQGR